MGSARQQWAIPAAWSQMDDVSTDVARSLQSFQCDSDQGLFEGWGHPPPSSLPLSEVVQPAHSFFQPKDLCTLPSPSIPMIYHNLQVSQHFWSDKQSLGQKLDPSSSKTRCLPQKMGTRSPGGGGVRRPGGCWTRPHHGRGSSRVQLRGEKKSPPSVPDKKNLSGKFHGRTWQSIHCRTRGGSELARGLLAGFEVGPPGRYQ